MKALLVHPGPLMYSEIYLRLEPLGLELVAESLRRAGHTVRLVDLQVLQPKELRSALGTFCPDVVGFGLNYLANLPEVVDLAKQVKARLPACTVFVGGHSASFTASEILEHAAGAVDAVLRGEGEVSAPLFVKAIASDRGAGMDVPGSVTTRGEGPPPCFARDLNDLRPARDLLPRRRKYFIGELDPCASIEFTRGCPWDCSFCSAWTFYGRSYRVVSPEKAAEDLASIRETGVFIVDDVAFIRSEHGFRIGEEIERRGIRKKYYLETRADVLLRNKEVFAFWRKLGLEYMFLGVEALDAEGLERFRKRSTLDTNMEALEYARSLGIMVAINLIVDPDWDEERFELIRQWAREIPDIVHLTVNTPYPGTESWVTEGRELTSRDYRLFDIQHAVLPTKLPLSKFYEELVRTQRILATKHLGWAALRDAARIAAGHLLRGQTNFVSMLWKFNRVYNAQRQLEDHKRPVRYEMHPPPIATTGLKRRDLYVHQPARRQRQTDLATERFVTETRG